MAKVDRLASLVKKLTKSSNVKVCCYSTDLS